MAVAFTQYQIGRKDFKEGSNEDMAVDGSSSSKTYKVEAPTSDSYNVVNIVLSIASGDTGWTSTKFANLTALTNGVVFRLYDSVASDTIWTNTIKDNIDLFGFFNGHNDITFSDSVRLVTFEICAFKQSAKPYVSTLIDNYDLEIIIQDNLSTLTEMRAYANYVIV